jgi:arylsulfatase
VRLRFAPALVLLLMPACFLFERKPPQNLLVIAVDGLRFDAISQSIGSAATPNMQKLAADGLLFSRCYAASPSTLATHVALLSARMPHTSGVISDNQALDAKLPLVAEHLADEGWQTFGDVSQAILRPPAPKQGLDRGFHIFHTHEVEVAPASVVNQWLLRFLHNTNADAPWFAYVEYADPVISTEDKDGASATYDVLLDDAKLETRTTVDVTGFEREMRLQPGLHRIEFRSRTPIVLRKLQCSTPTASLDPTYAEGRMSVPATRIVAQIRIDSGGPVDCKVEALVRVAPQVAEARARYKTEVERVDRAIGDVVEALRRTGQYDRTLIVVTGSHGQALGEHGVLGDGVNLYDEMLRVPLVVKPFAEEPRRDDLVRAQYGLVRQIDIVPTLLDLVGEKTLPGAEGTSLLDDADRTVMAETHPPDAPGTLFAMRDERYKLVYIAKEARFEMFDARSDTLELDNIFPLQGHFRTAWQKEMRNLASVSTSAGEDETGWEPAREAPKAAARQ